MNAITIFVISIVALFMGYIFYGGWLAKTWGINPNKKTPAVKSNDNDDYVPTERGILFGHHFSSIAGASPISGPVQAAIFGWVPVVLWIVLGGIFLVRHRIFLLCLHPFAATENPLWQSRKKCREIRKTTVFNLCVVYDALSYCILY